MTSNGKQICGRVVSGEGSGRHFTRLPWARRQFIDKLGIDPYPGTVNLIVVDAESRSVWDRLKDKPGVRICKPNRSSQDCNARCYPVSIGEQVSGAIVLPEVADYAVDQVEIIAAMGIRDALGLNDGDPLILEIREIPRITIRAGHAVEARMVLTEPGSSEGAWKKKTL